VRSKLNNVTVKSFCYFGGLCTRAGEELQSFLYRTGPNALGNGSRNLSLHLVYLALLRARENVLEGNLLEATLLKALIYTTNSAFENTSSSFERNRKALSPLGGLVKLTRDALVILNRLLATGFSGGPRSLSSCFNCSIVERS
jgi:hypothetical protein